MFALRRRHGREGQCSLGTELLGQEKREQQAGVFRSSGKAHSAAYRPPAWLLPCHRQRVLRLSPPLRRMTVCSAVPVRWLPGTCGLRQLAATLLTIPAVACLGAALGALRCPRRQWFAMLARRVWQHSETGSWWQLQAP